MQNSQPTFAQQFLAEILSFCDANKMKLSYFGQHAAQDWVLVDRLKAGRSITMDKVDELRRYMANYPRFKAGEITALELMELISPTRAKAFEKAKARAAAERVKAPARRSAPKPKKKKKPPVKTKRKRKSK